MKQDPLDGFHWEPQPEAEKWVLETLSQFLSRNPAAAAFAKRLPRETATRFHDWVDTIVSPAGVETVAKLTSVGFVQTGSGESSWRHPGGVFPRVVLSPEERTTVYLKADCVATFLATHNVSSPIDGLPLAPLRTARVWPHGDTALAVVERRGALGLTAPETREGHAGSVLRALERFRLRQRDFGVDGDANGFDELEAARRAATEEVGVATACSLFFAAEREYWQRRNRAAREQWSRQDALGLGWANHDHHTYRSSRANFLPLIRFFLALGFEARERFYAGSEAGWGAQVLEHPDTGIVIFADVDLSPEELRNDFANDPLAKRHSLGTVGLWCRLHGDSILQAGMHHLECQFDFDALTDQLAADSGIDMMAPFSNFPHLRQAFTEGERWSVDPARIAALVDDGLIDDEQARSFRDDGAIGSHLENLERNAGFKGFNQQGVSEIISATDPRKLTR